METLDGAVHFGSFEVDLRTEELRKNGKKLRLPRQSYQVLVLLLRRRGELVTREELRQTLWPADTFVDFDHGLNAAVNRLREALGDSAEEPHFIETLPRRGYRFIAPVEDATPVVASGRAQSHGVQQAGAVQIPKPAEHVPVVATGPIASRGLRIVLVAIVGLGLLLGLYLLNLRTRVLDTTRSRQIESLAVLPLENLSGDPAQEYFADGMTDALITELGKLGKDSGLRVISRTSAMYYKGTRKMVPEIARKLNVDAVIEGAVLRSGDHVRITAQLIRAEPEEHLWSEEFKGEMNDVLTLQNRVTRAIAAQIRRKLAEQHPRSINSEAYEFYLKGSYIFWERGSKEAVRYFELAIEKDETYAPPHAGLAQAYALSTYFGIELSPREACSKATAAATKALELDDQLAEAHIALAIVRFRCDWNWPEAEREFKRGLELNPNDAIGHTTHGIFLANMGRLDEALAETTQALRLDPFSPRARNGISKIYLFSHRYDEAIAESRKTLELYPDFAPAYDDLAVNYGFKGLYAQSVSEELKYQALTGNSPEQIELLRKAFAASGIRGFREKLLELEKRRPNPNYFALSRLCVSLGRTDEAFDWLEKAYEARYPNMPNLKIGAVWLDPVRSDPRYADLVRRVGLPQ